MYALPGWGFLAGFLAGFFGPIRRKTVVKCHGAAGGLRLAVAGGVSLLEEGADGARLGAGAGAGVAALGERHCFGG